MNNIYINKLIKENDITFLQETMITEIRKMKEIIKNENDYYIYSIDAEKCEKQGRPRGGMTWIIRKNLNARVTHHSKRISQLTIGNIAIIGAHMIYYDGSKENNTNYEIDINHIIQIYKELKEKYETIIVGDFNAEIDRNNQIDVIFTKKLEENDLQCMDKKYIQKENKTFWKNNKDAWIDHVIASTTNDTIEQVTIDDDEDNLSDHLTMKVSATIEIGEEIQEKRRSKIHPKWKDAEYIIRYRRYLKEPLKRIVENIKTTDGMRKEEIEREIESIIENLHNTLRQGAEKATNISKKQKKHKRSNIWWNEEINRLHKKAIESYRSYKADGAKCVDKKKALKMAKADLRREQRKVMKQLKNNKINQ